MTQFLELARAEAGLPDEDRESLDLGALLRGLCETAAADPRFQAVTIAADGPKGESLVLGAPHRLESAFRNLLDNAASFASDAGQVQVTWSNDSRATVVVVEDTGPGIVPEDLPRVFDRFYTTRGEREGTGLGLALTRAVVEAQGGSIRAESPPGKGARLVVRLPRA